ncbi:unnamed protein product, partial [Ascophyllum nodosum]
PTPTFIQYVNYYVNFPNPDINLVDVLPINIIFMLMLIGHGKISPRYVCREEIGKVLIQASTFRGCLRKSGDTWVHIFFIFYGRTCFFREDCIAPEGSQVKL